MSETTQATVVFLGIGQMGAPMATRLLHAGFAVRAWNRSPERAESLAKEGATVAASPADAARGADFVITMLPDGAAVESVMADEDGALSTLSKEALWLQMSTIGVEWCQRLADAAKEHGVGYLDSPVSGSVGAAANGTLVILASGPRDYEKAATPVFEAMGRFVWLGDVGAGSAAKLVLNNWLANIVEITVEMIRFSSALGLDPHAIIDLLDGLPIGSPYGVAKARQMLAGDVAPSFALKHALKDVDLALATAHEHGVSLRVSESFAEAWHRAVDNGFGDDDVSAIYAAETSSSVN